MRAGLAAVLMLAAGWADGASQTGNAGAAGSANGPLSVAPKQWATDAALNELKVIDYGRSYLRYRERTRNVHGDLTRDVIESKDGTVARLILKEGRALTTEEDAAEHDRLQAMIDSPSAYAKHVKSDASGKKMGADLIKLMPDAMIFAYTPGQPQRAGREIHPDDPPEIVMDYKPNPAWTPPNTTAEALVGIEGRVWVDARTHFLTRMEGTVFRPVNVGWFLAHIYPGGHLTFEQTQVHDQRWIFTHFTEHIDLRVLIKNLKEDSDIEASNFSQVPEMSYKDAIHMLLATPLPKN